MREKLLIGSFWLLFFNIVCKIFGFIYLIFWLKFMGIIYN